MKWFAEKYTYKYTDENDKIVTGIKYLYPYCADKMKPPPYANGITQVEIPEPPGEYYVPGEGKTFTWVLDIERWLNEKVRPVRDAMLTDIDLKDCNAEKWESMTIADKENWKAYKQALRDLPETIDENMTWPKAPGHK